MPDEIRPAEAEGSTTGDTAVVSATTRLPTGHVRRRAQDQRLLGHQTALLALTRTVQTCRSLGDAVRRSTEAAATALGVARVSVWLYTPDRRAIRCLDLFEAPAERHSAGAELFAATHPDYFRALEESELVAADDARTDPRTREFTTGYLTPLGIGAMLDVPLRPFGRLEGVLCCEHVGPPRRWEADEQVFAVAVGTLVSLAQERSERERAEAELRAGQERMRATLAALPDFVFVLSADGTHLDFHAPHHERLYARPAEFLGRRVRDVLPDGPAGEYEGAIRRTLATGQMQVFGYALDVPGGGRQAFEARMVPMGGEVLAVVRNVTEQQKLEDQLRQAQKLEAVGRLAGGVAHDFNNILTVINGFSDMALDALPAGDPVRELVEEVRASGERAAGLTRQLLAYGRKQILRPQVLDLGGLTADLGSMLRRLLGEDIELVLDPRPALVTADPGQLSQVVMNLAVNARDAMPRGGRLAVRTRAVSLAAGAAQDGAEVRAGAYTLLEVSDTGQGMSADVRAHIFEPFFTTKKAGTGLGLATVYGIVKQSGGHVEVESGSGRGTTFRVYLPEAGLPSPAAADGPAAGEATVRGTGTVLLVEDDDGVRALTMRTLQQAGYTVVDAACGERALEVLAAYNFPVDLLVTDVVMPGMGGRALADRLAVARPEARVLFMSGYTDDAVLRHGVEQDRVNFIAKPFTMAALARKVKDVLDAR